MQAGSLAGGDVRALSTRILVNGVVRAHESWSIGRDIVGDLPEQVVAGGGIRQATGSISWAEQSDVTDVAVNPWNVSTGWLPKSGEPVQVLVSDGVNEWSQFKGVIDETTGTAGEAPQSTIIDNTDSLNLNLDHPTVFRTHPPTVEGGGLMGVGMGPAYIIDRALRLCGFYCTPRQEAGSLVSATGQTSLWAERGYLTSSVNIPSSYRTAWGWCLSSFNATYSPIGSATRADPIQLTVRVAAEHTGTFTLDAKYGADFIRLLITPARGVIARFNGTNIVTLASMGAETVVTLLVRAGVWTIKTPSATATANSAVPAGAAFSSVVATADVNSRVAGMQVTKPTTTAWDFYAIRHVDTYFGHSASLSGTMDVLPSLSLRSAVDVLTEISKATLAPFWFDELGKVQFISSDVLYSRTPVQTVTTLDDITKLSWSDSLMSTRSKVTVKYRDLTVSRSIYSNITLWQGAGESLESGQVANFIASEPADEDWAEVATTYTGPTGPALVLFNQGKGTWVHAYLEDDDRGFTDAAGYVTWSTISNVSRETFKVTATAGTLPAGTHVVIGYPSDLTKFAPRFASKGSPILRGRGKAVWVEASIDSATVGPVGSPELLHDAGPWLSQEGSKLYPTRVADFIAAQVSTPKPVITGMEVIYDPRRQLGDVITISSPTYLGVTLTALIVGIRNGAGPDYTQSLDVRIITAKTTFTTYAEYNKTIPDGLTYAQWQLLGPLPQTYSQFNTAA